MLTSISTIHRNRFDEIKKSLHTLGYKEGHFLKIELLFFEALSISRSYGENPRENDLLASLKNLQHDQYQKTSIITKKPGQRELNIKRFVISLRKALSINE